MGKQLEETCRCRGGQAGLVQCRSGSSAKRRLPNGAKEEIQNSMPAKEVWRRLPPFAVAMLALALTGCATMDRDECLMADWRSVGFEDGRNGQLTSYVGEHREACAGHGVTPNLTEYLAGHSQGIAEYCRPQNGFRLGQSGQAYRGECPAGLEADFVESHADGYGLYERREEVNRLRREVDLSLYREDQLQQMITQKRGVLASPDTSREQREDIRAEIEELVDERWELRRAIGRLEFRLEQALHDLDTYQKNLEGR